MIYSVITQPHPLDAIWSSAVEAVSDAQHAVDALPAGHSDEECNTLSAKFLDCVDVVMALPARNISDSLYKLDLSGLGEDGPLGSCDQHAIMAEATALLDAAIARGRAFQREATDAAA